MIGCPCGTREELPRMKMVGNFGMLVALRALLDVLEIVQAEADDLAGWATGKPNLSPLSGRGVGHRRAALRRILERGEVAIVAAEHLAEVARNIVVDGLQVDHPSPSTTPRCRPPSASKPTIFMSTP